MPWDSAHIIRSLAWSKRPWKAFLVESLLLLEFFEVFKVGRLLNTVVVNISQVNHLASSVEQVVSSIRHNSWGRGFGATRVIERIPFIVSPVLGISSVMTTAESTKVIRDTEEIINIRLCFIIWFVKNVRLKVQSFNREIDWGWKFSTATAVAIWSVSWFSSLESFQANY